MLQPSCQSKTRLAWLAVLLPVLAGTAVAELPVAGTQPHARPADAPQITGVTRDPAWHDRALHGVSQPIPPSLRWLDSQGNWYTPFTRPGMTPPYDIRGWHAGPAPSDQAARWDPIHFKPAIESATDAQCLACHKEVLEPSVLPASPAGVKASDALAWYQTLETYEGPQETFHRRHLVTPLAKELMALKCTTCHQGNDPREEASGSAADTPAGLTLRKMVDPSVCLMCHAPYNHEVMNMPGPWAEHRETFQTCMACHAAFRTNRHQVNFLQAEAIEKAGNENADSCYGCHGGRAWYRIHYPYPRHDWDGMPAEVPDWAKSRPKQSDARFLKGLTKK